MGCAGSKGTDADKDGKAPKAKGKAGTPDRLVSVKNWVLKPSTDIRNHYELGKVLGKGQFGITRLAIDKRTGEKLACKTISKRKLVNPDDIEDVRREVQIMHHLAGHPNVVQLRGTYEDKSDVHLVMEVCSGGELFDRIVERGHYTEKDAARMVRTIVAVVGHCHNMGVIHRDLKPENFLLTDTSKDAAVKATDFGLSVFFKEGQMFTDIVGSAYYVAPEVLRRKYTKEADIWSCGVILYILLCGVPPFFGDTEQQIFEAVLRAPLDFSADPWPKISAGAKDCVRKMLVRDPAKRATAQEILNHDWLREGGEASDVIIEPEVLKRLKGFAAMNKLKKEALKVIAFNLPLEEIQGLKAMFESMDNDKSGTITIEEMREGLKAKGWTDKDAELNRLMADADVNGDGTIDYQEFLAATIHLGKLEQEDHLYKAFQYFDKDGSGTITREELLTALAGYPDVMAHVDAVLKEVDTDGNGEIDYDEFCKMMRSNDGGKLRNSTLRNTMFLPK